MTDVRPGTAAIVASVPSRGLTLRRMAGTIAAAVALNLVVFGVGSAAGATWLANGQTITWILVVVATVVAMSLGLGVTTLLSRRWSAGRRVIAWMGLVFAVVSAPAPLIASDDAPTRWALAAMHVVSGVVWFVGVRPRGAASKG